MKYCLVQSESCDWYVIPANKRQQWYDRYMFADNPPKWATYVDLNTFTFDAWSAE